MTGMRVANMAKFLHRADAETLHSVGPSLLEKVSWDDLRIFVFAARERSFRKAAGVARTSSSTVVRRIERLEDGLGVGQPVEQANAQTVLEPFNPPHHG